MNRSSGRVAAFVDTWLEENGDDAGTKFINPGSSDTTGWLDTEYSHRMCVLTLFSMMSTVFAAL
jgi:hypothetical protein